ncbi:MAG: UvrD-helicase domain-containing protein [Bacteroidales bacterium]|nr:UvrD-helicase domain-containing protein [Bacteroidales bacterium]
MSRDEVQDLSSLQFKIMRQLSSHHGNYMCVGDDLQSVYAFRGGDVSNIMNINQIDPDIETILLEQNYRSTNNIIQASNGFIAHNKKQLNKVSFTENQEGLPVMVYESEDELREAEYIVTMIQGMIQSGEYKYEDIAVLYRANYLSQNIALTFSSAGIPYDVQNGFNFYEREEVKTLVGYLRILDNPLDDIALEYVLNRPKRSIGDVTVDRLKMYAADVNIPLSVALAHADDIPKVNKPTKQRIRDFADLLDAMRAQLQNDPNIVRLLHYIVKQTGLMKSYDVQRTKDIERIDNIQELFNIAAMFELKDKEPLEEGQTSLSQFLTETALYAKPETGEELVGKVTLISSHGSKGMEYPVVFIIGLEQGIFPSYHALDDIDNLEEERRLMYVSMTRAEKVLFLSYNKKRYSFGRMQHCKPSQFIEELPKEYVKFLGK